MPWGEGPRLRWRRLLKWMEEQQLDMLVMGGQKNIYYFTGYITARLFMPAYLFIPVEGEPFLVTGKADSEQAAKTFGGEIVEYVNYNLDNVMRPYPIHGVEAAVKTLRRRQPKIRKLGYEGWALDAVLLHEMLKMFPTAEFTDVSENILLMRRSKDEDELQYLREAAKLNDSAYRVAKENAAVDRSEAELYTIIHSELVKKKGGFQFFAGDFVSGERCLQIGGPPTSRRLQVGDTLILDLWVTHQEYWSDTCRTFVVGAVPSALQKRVFEVLREALKAGEAALRPGATGSDVYRAVYEAIERHGYGKYFPHHAGHALGLEAWEPPYFIPGDQNIITENTVCALEPGIYFGEVGGVRLENNYVVKRYGVEVLNEFPLEP
ncbi:MAG: Xaa-Pro peptidase family protein [Candidatus Caldarchaeum sp.]|jgi:Xaa-Pro aminopeptidase|uniref:Aminopeptidase P family protein n=1 Tax=Caldiarchaeum subterraneum TaxID=311458 RepID=A0A7J3WCN6_CALS0